MRAARPAAAARPAKAVWRAPPADEVEVEVASLVALERREAMEDEALLAADEMEAPALERAPEALLRAPEMLEAREDASDAAEAEAELTTLPTPNRVVKAVVS